MKHRWIFSKNRILLYLLVFLFCIESFVPIGKAADFTNEEVIETETEEAIETESEETIETETTQIGETETCFPETVYGKELPQSVNQTIKEVRAYVLSEDKNPDKDSQWYVLSCARSGLSLEKKYFKTAFRNILSYLIEKDGVITGNQYSEYSKMILVLTSMGYDARDVGGYNLFSYLSDFTKVKKQGVNGPVWALLALDCHPFYEIPVNEDAEIQTTKELLISYLLERELEGGGWAFSREKADTDMTAMTIQALAPYYQLGYEGVDEAIDRGIAVLSAIQNPETGGFQSGGIDNLESCAQVVVALSSLGINCKEDSRFVKNGNWPVYDLISYQIEDSGFRHSKDGNLNKLATAQGFYALDAYQRLNKGLTSLYDMSDVVLTVGKIEDLPEESPAGSEAESIQETKPPKERPKETKEETKAHKETESSKETKGHKETESSKETKAQYETRVQKETQAQKERQPERETKAYRPTESQKDTMLKQEDASPAKDSVEYAETGEGAWAFEGEDYVSSDSMDQELWAETGTVEENRMEVRKGGLHRERDLGLLGSMAGIAGLYCLYDYFRKKHR